MNANALPRNAWYQKDKGTDTARALYSQGMALELANYKRRYRQALLYRLVTGEEAPDLFSYWMSDRAGVAIGRMGLGDFREPEHNVVASALEVFCNRIGTLRPFVQVIPTGGDFELRDGCSQAEFFLDALFDHLCLYHTTFLTFGDGGTWGTGVVKVAPHPNGKELAIERTLMDEILIDDAAARMGKPATLIQRRYMTRDDATALFVDTAPSAQRDVRMSAIRSAPLAFAANYWSGPAPVEQIALLEGYKLPGADGAPGRRVLSLPTATLEDDPWTRDHFPYAVFRWTPQSLGFWGRSAAMALLPYQVTINKNVERAEANKDRMAYSGWAVRGNTQLRAEALGGRPGRIIRSNGEIPTPVTPPSNAPEIYEDIERWERRAYTRVGLNMQQAAGLKQPGITSGRALRTMVQIEDARNQSLQISLEYLVRDIAVLAVEAADEMNLSIEIPGMNGGRRSWKDIGIKSDSAKISVFPVSALPNDPAGRQQQIAEWYADGTIDKRTKFRLQNMPDLQAYARLATAGDDLIETQLDEIVRTGKFVAPEPFDDMAGALTMARSRYWLEKRILKGPKKKAVLRQLQAFMISLSDKMVSGQQFLAPAAPAQQGIAPPAGTPQPPAIEQTPSIAA